MWLKIGNFQYESCEELIDLPALQRNLYLDGRVRWAGRGSVVAAQVAGAAGEPSWAGEKEAAWLRTGRCGRIGGPRGGDWAARGGKLGAAQGSRKPGAGLGRSACAERRGG